MKVFLFVLVAALSATHATGVTIETVAIGNPGNAPDSNGLGSVPYSFRMGKYEVTNAQYVDFLNAVDPTGSNQLGLYKTFLTNNNSGGVLRDTAQPQGTRYSIKSGYANNPVIFMTWYNAARFANWLNNGQGGPGTTEYGAYTLLGNSAIPSNAGSIIFRRGDAKWFLPNENEWYKTAYHQYASEGGDADDYWLYPTRSNVVPDSDEPPGTDAPNPANTGNIRGFDGLSNGYNDGFATTGSQSLGNEHYTTDVGAYDAAAGPYGTFDQAGNVHEWLDNVGPGLIYTAKSRGGGWIDAADISSASTSAMGFRDSEYNYIGFRVATFVPEPSAFILLMLAATGFVLSRN